MATETPTLYKVLGVSKDADKDALLKAYRKLIKQFHPDGYKPGEIQPREARLTGIARELKREGINEGERAALEQEQQKLNRELEPLRAGRKEQEEKLKPIAAAYDILSNNKKRGQYDRGEIDENGNVKGFGIYRPGAGGGFDPFDFDDIFGGARRSSRGGFANKSFEDILNEMFRDMEEERRKGSAGRTSGGTGQRQGGYSSDPRNNSQRSGAGARSSGNSSSTNASSGSQGTSSTRSQSTSSSTQSRSASSDSTAFSSVKDNSIDSSTMLGAMFTLVGGLFISHAHMREKQKKDQKQEITWQDRAYKIAAWVGTGAVLAATLYMWSRSKTQRT